jgi:hypothetical protein
VIGITVGGIGVACFPALQPLLPIQPEAAASKAENRSIFTIPEKVVVVRIGATLSAAYSRTLLISMVGKHDQKRDTMISV